LVFALPDGNYSIKACHKGDQNYGESENVTEIEVFSDITIESLTLNSSSKRGFTSPFVSSGVGNLTLEVSSYTPYALLSMNATAQYTADVVLEGSWVFILFFVDCTNATGFLGAAVLDPDVSPPYFYEAHLIWTPELVGSHKLISGVTAGDLDAFLDAMINGTGMIALTEVYLDIQRCPSNIVLNYPEAIYGDTLPITVALSKPRPYGFFSNNFYSAVTLAPRFSYGGVEYVVDEGINSSLVRLYIDGTLVSANLTDANGLVHFSTILNFTGVNMTVVVDGPSFLYENRLERIVSFTRVNVSDVPAAGSDQFNLTYSVNGLAGGGELYVRVENPLETRVSLFDRSVWNVPVSIISAKFVSRLKAKMFGSASDIPAGSDYLRVVSFHNDTVVASDINNDGIVDLDDVIIVGNAFGSYPGHPRWNPDADLDGDDIVDITDVVLVSMNFGRADVYNFYYPPQGVYLVFDSGQVVYVDSRGCVGLPSGATSFTVWKDDQIVGAFIEFFKIAINKNSFTNNLGKTVVVWKPMEIGRHLVQVKLPSSFSVVLDSYSGVASVDAPVNLVGYFDVVKRPIDLSVDYTPSDPTLSDDVTLIAHCFDVALGEDAGGLHVDFYAHNLTGGEDILLGGSVTNSSGVATLLWNPKSFSEQYNL
jgi:hypothetical protein